MQMRNAVLAVLALSSLVACSGRGAEANRARFERSVGTGSGPDIYERSMKVIRQYQFELERETQPPTLYLETRWRNRTPFPDEQALGINQAQIRMIVRTSARSSTPQGQLFDVNLAVETRVQTAGSSDWSEAVATPQYQAYVQRIFEDLKRELEIGVRRYDDG